MRGEITFQADELSRETVLFRVHKVRVRSEVRYSLKEPEPKDYDKTDKTQNNSSSRKLNDIFDEDFRLLIAGQTRCGKAKCAPGKDSRFH